MKNPENRLIEINDKLFAENFLAVAQARQRELPNELILERI